MKITPALIIVLAIILLFAIRGFRKGLVGVIFAIVGIIFTLSLVSVITPYVSDYLTDHTQLYNKIEEKSVSVIEDAMVEGMEETAENQQKMLEESGLELPSIAKSKIVENANSAIYGLVEGQGIIERLGQNVANTTFRIIIFVCSFVIVYIAIRLLYYMLNAVVKLPGIRVVNKTAGAVIGLVEGLLVVWICFLVLTAFAQTEFASTVIAAVLDNPITAILYNGNVLLYMILAFL